MNTLITQGSKDTRTLKIDDTELGEVTAEEPGDNLALRARNDRSIEKDSISGDETLKKDHSDLWTSMKPSNDDDDKSNKRKPIRKTRPNLLVEVSKRMKKFVNDEGVYYNLNKLLSDPYFLIACYENIKGKPGNMTKGIDNYTLDGLNGEWFMKVAKDLHDGTFKFNPGRLKDISKGNGQIRTLSITSPSSPVWLGPLVQATRGIKISPALVLWTKAGRTRDKIVQKAIGIILEAAYEPLFSIHSFGFRPKKSTHDALSELRLRGAGFTWVIQGDIDKCFDSIPHSIIRREINKVIGCPNMRSLIDKVIAYPISNKDNIIIKNKIGTPQGTICSPILANIVLDVFDKYMENYISIFNKGKLKRHNSEYIKLQYLRKKAIQNEEHSLAIQYLVQMRKLNSYDNMDSSFRRMYYIRYADDFIILVTGSHKECIEIRENITQFLKENCGLTLNKDKTLITSMRKHFKFLGASIVNNPTKDYVVYDKGLNTWKKAHVRSLVKAPIKDLVEKLMKNGLAKRNRLNKVFPKGRTSLFNHSHYNILRWYNSLVNGILNYYSFASNRPKLGYIIWLLRASCALTIANKYKLKTKSKAFKKHGFNLKDPETGLTFYISTEFKVINDYKTHKTDLDELDKTLNSDWASNLQETSFGKACAICGSTNKIEMHHVRKVANIRSKFKVDGQSSSKLISAMNRKQIPLCYFHHKELHKGNLGYWEYRKVAEYQ
jgi:group II intron reverse transcriptase/maturase